MLGVVVTLPHTPQLGVLRVLLLLLRMVLLLLMRMVLLLKLLVLLL